MKVNVKRTYEVTVNASLEEVRKLINAIEDTFQTYVKEKKDTTAIDPLLAFKDNLILAIEESD